MNPAAIIMSSRRRQALKFTPSAERACVIRDQNSQTGWLGGMLLSWH